MKHFTSAILIAGISSVNAVENLCTAGSDAECARYGKNMCCARIQYDY